MCCVLCAVAEEELAMPGVAERLGSRRRNFGKVRVGGVALERREEGGGGAGVGNSDPSLPSPSSRVHTHHPPVGGRGLGGGEEGSSWSRPIPPSTLRHFARAPSSPRVLSCAKISKLHRSKSAVGFSCHPVIVQQELIACSCTDVLRPHNF